MHSSAFKSISDTLRRPRLSIGFFVLALTAAVLGAWYLFHWARAKPPAPFQSMNLTKLTNTGKTVDAAISPDGEYLVDVIEEGGKQGLWLRQINVPAASKEIVAPTDGQYEGLTFSRDGKYVYYTVWENNARDVLYQVPLLGNFPRRLPVQLDSPVGFSAAGNQIAFIRRDTNRGESAVIIANPDGTGERMLAKRKEPAFFTEVAPAWSPDGKTIACSVRSASGGFRGSVVQINVADGVETPLTRQSWAIVERVVWLTDGRGLIITAADDASSPFQIWHLSFPGGTARRITNDLNSYMSLSLSGDSSKLITVQSDRLSNISVVTSGNGPARQITSGVSKHQGVAWTPKGRIVFSSIVGGNSDLWIMHSDGSNQKQLTADVYVDRDPSVSSDGRYILFASNRAGRFNVWRMDLDGNNLKQLTDGDDEEFPQCSPDNEWVVYQGFVNGVPSLWRVPVDGGTPVQLTNKYSNWPAISPDGKLIACSYLDEASGPWKLAVIPFTGGEPIKYFAMPIPYLQHFVWQRIRWTADGQALTYIDKRGGISNIWSQGLSGGSPKQLTDLKADQIFHFAWSNDGKQLAYVRGLITSDVVLISQVK